MLRENLKLSELSGMCVPSDANAGILPHLSEETAQEMRRFLMRPLVETGFLIASLLIVFKFLY